MLRGFTDAGGTEWRVWQVLPSPIESQQQEAADSLMRMTLTGTPFANGWLCFESAAEKRRLAPIPEGWEFLDPPTLQELCERAQLVPVRRPRGQAAAAQQAVSG